ncbi:MAG: copper resistance system multicopper oxidase [Pseudomonadota bacterium]
MSVNLIGEDMESVAKDPTLHGRRRFLRTTAALGLLQVFRGLAPAYAQSLPASGGEIRVGGSNVAELVIARTSFGFAGQHGSAVTINGTLPGPLLRFREGEIATLRVTNRLDETTSIHWHGILVPSEMDGVPGVSFPGIAPGETFTYRFPVRQSGTYWYHSHSSLQEQQGFYAPLIMEPLKADPVAFDREHVIVLSDWTFRDPHRVLAVLKKRSGYFNFQQRTIGDFFREAKANGFKETFSERAMWGRMRMNPTDILDVTGAAYTYLVNGLPPDGNWTALFSPGERVRLRFINSAANSHFNVRIPGLPMTIVQADGQNVQPVTVDEFQIAIAETYDVIVQPSGEQAYTIFAEAMDRSGYGRGTLAPHAGMSAPVPKLRERPLRTMVDMGMDMENMNMPGMKMGGMNHGASEQKAVPARQHGDAQMKSMAGMEHGDMQVKPMPGMQHGDMQMKAMPGMASPINGRHGPDTHGPGNQMVAMVQRNRLGEPGTGLHDVGHRVLVYNDLKALEPSPDPRPHEREIEIHLTGDMEAFIWGMDGLKFSESGDPPRFRVGERVRITLVNDTMMEHPMHLHGVFMEIDNGAGLAHKPRKHTINVKPAERLSFDFTYDEPGNFAFHCHVLFHMEMGMFRFVNVSGAPQRKLT